MTCRIRLTISSVAPSPLGQRVDVSPGALFSACPPVTINILLFMWVSAFLLFLCEFLFVLPAQTAFGEAHSAPASLEESGHRTDGKKGTREPGLFTLTHRPEEWVLRVKMLESSVGAPAPGCLAYLLSC